MSARETSVVMGGAEWGMLLALTLLWSATVPFAKIALAELPPLTLVLVRVALAALALNMVVLASGRRMALIGLGLAAIDERPRASIRQAWRPAWAAS